MGKARKCDRCGTFFEPKDNIKAINSIVLRHIKYNGTWEPVREADLCSKCAEEILLWYDNPKDASVNIVRHTPLGTTNKPADGINKRLEDDLAGVLEIEEMYTNPVDQTTTIIYKDGSEIVYDHHGKPIVERRSSNA